MAKKAKRWSEEEWAAWEKRARARLTGGKYKGWSQEKKNRYVYGLKRRMGWEPGKK